MNRLRKSLLPLLLLMIGVIGLSSCSEDDNKTPDVITKIALDKTSQALTVGESFTLKAEITPANAEDGAITWSSDKAEVATVSDKGEVKAIAAGEAIITASLKNGNKATCKVTVTAKEEKEEEKPTLEATVTFKEKSYTVKYEETLDLAKEVKLTNGTDDDLNFTWKSSDEYTVSISKDGVAKGEDIGEATIEVSLPNGKTASCTVKVIGNEDEDDNNDEGETAKIVTLQPWRVEVEEGQTFQLTINYNGINKDEVVLKSTNEEVVTVTNDGLITGIAAGSAQIIIEVNGKAQHNNCPVTVNPKIEKGRFTYVIRHVKKESSSEKKIILNEVVGDDKTINDVFYSGNKSSTANSCFVYLDITDTKTNEVVKKDFATKWEIVASEDEDLPVSTGFNGDITWYGEAEFDLKIISEEYGINETIKVIIKEKTE